MGNGAPVCLLPNQGQATPDMPAKQLTTVPQAVDLPTALQAINNIRNILKFITGPRSFIESGRVTQLVKVFNPDDDSQFVIVERINAVTFKDPLTGITFTWKR
jgi:hypothetical protein